MTKPFVSVWQVIDYLMGQLPSPSCRIPVDLVTQMMEEFEIARPGDRSPSAVVAGLTAYANDRWTIGVQGGDLVFTRKPSPIT